jgi:hypothetical protein
MNNMKTVGRLRAAAAAATILCAIALAAGTVSVAARPDAQTCPNLPSAQLVGQPLGLFKSHGDIGPVQLPGRAVYDSQKQEYLVEGTGANMWFGTDEFHFVWKRLKGDFILSARVQFIGRASWPTGRPAGWPAQPSTPAHLTPLPSSTATG